MLVSKYFYYLISKNESLEAQIYLIGYWSADVQCKKVLINQIHSRGLNQIRIKEKLDGLLNVIDGTLSELESFEPLSEEIEGLMNELIIE